MSGTLKGSRSSLSFFLAAVVCCAAAPPRRVLVIADEIPAMEIMARRVAPGAPANLEFINVKPDALPPDFSRFSVVVVYIHRALPVPVETACLRWAESGGRLVLLHHSISSGKRPNQEWLPALGVHLPTGPFAQGGYRYIEGITMTLVNLAPRNPVTSHNVPYPETLAWTTGEGVRNYPAFTLEDTEVYLNHRFEGPRTVLLGLHTKDPATGAIYEQATAGWYRRLGKGWVLYFMAGHSARDFESPSYSAIVRNALTVDLK
jgi:hypothetical protein